MLFNSYQFVFLFLPLALIVCSLAARAGERLGIAALLVASLLFYASWDIRFLILLLGSILTNYGIGVHLSAAMKSGREGHATNILAAGIIANLIVLGVFKYAHFGVDNINTLFQTNIRLGEIILPLGISFFTFEQIGYLIDIRRGNRYNASLLNYSVFVSFFPRLVAGPILRFNEIDPQLSGKGRARATASDLAVGLSIFAIGLAKKTILADSMSPFAGAVFNDAAGGASPELFTAWSGALAYTLQIYFDFSGYSDMAIGAARCLGIRFPLNFDSPYKSLSIIEFWRRWHMTLSRFLRDYLYVGLGGNRKGAFRRYANLMATMLLGGLWHGANWTFMVWGGLHGLYLIVNHFFRMQSERKQGLGSFMRSGLGKSASFALTFLAVVVAWVFFRAPSFSSASHMLAGMFGFNGASLPAGLAFALAPVQPVLDALGIGYGGQSGTVFVQVWAWIVCLFAVAFFLPNTQQILCAYEPALDYVAKTRVAIKWAPNMVWAGAIGGVAFLAVISMTRISEFIYWQF